MKKLKIIFMVLLIVAVVLLAANNIRQEIKTNMLVDWAIATEGQLDWHEHAIIAHDYFIYQLWFNGDEPREMPPPEEIPPEWEGVSCKK